MVSNRFSPFFSVSLGKSPPPPPPPTYSRFCPFYLNFLIDWHIFKIVLLLPFRICDDVPLFILDVGYLLLLFNFFLVTSLLSSLYFFGFHLLFLADLHEVNYHIFSIIQLKFLSFHLIFFMDLWVI